MVHIQTWKSLRPEGENFVRKAIRLPDHFQRGSSVSQAQQYFVMHSLMVVLA